MRSRAALQALPGGQPRVIGIMCRNHRGFIEAVVAANRIGTDLLLLNTSFAGPALAEVVAREGADAVIYDEEFAEIVDRALADRPDATHIVAWTDDPSAHSDSLTVEKMISAHSGQEPKRATEKPRTILLTSGTTGTPKGAKLTGGDPSALKAILDRTPWHTEEAIVVAAPMFHAWGFSQLIFAATMACTIVTRRKFDPEATLELVDRHKATGLAVVPVMFDRIMELPDGVRNRYSGRSLRFAAASGSRMRPDVVTAFMDQFGDVIYNNYNATEAGLIASATPEDLRAAPDTAGKPAPGTVIRVLDKDFREVPTGEVGQIYLPKRHAVRRLHLGQHQGLPRRLHGLGRHGLRRRERQAVRRRPRRRDDRLRRRERLPHRGGEDAGVARRCGRGRGDRGGRRTVRSAAGRVRGSERTAQAPHRTRLKQHVRESLANYKVPRQITVLDELPRSITGKIVRKDLQALVDNG